MDECCSKNENKPMCESCGTQLPANVCSVRCHNCGHKRDCSDN